MSSVGRELGGTGNPDIRAVPLSTDPTEAEPCNHVGIRENKQSRAGQRERRLKRLFFRERHTPLSSHSTWASACLSICPASATNKLAKCLCLVPVVHRDPSAGWLLLKTLGKKKRKEWYTGVSEDDAECLSDGRGTGGRGKEAGEGEKMSFWSKPPPALLVVDLVDSGLLVPGAGHDILIVY